MASGQETGPAASREAPPNPASQSGRVGVGSYLSDEDSANVLVVPTEGGEELMVSSGEATLIARAAAWMGRGRAVSAPTQINTTPNGSELPFVRLAFWTRQRPSLQPHSQTSSCPTPSHPTEIPDLSQVAPHLSCSECEKEQSSPLPTPSGGSLGPKLCHTNVALPSCAPPHPPSWTFWLPCG